MPGFWKKPAVSRLLSRLRSKRASSALVVETGFPTSLADLVVKQRARLRSRKPPSPPPPPPQPQPPPIGCTSAAAVAVEVRCIAPTAPMETGTTRWFGFLAATLLVVVLMVIGWRGIVSGITISAFVLLMFDFLGFRVLESLCRTRSEGLDLVERELVSPVREEDSELLQNCEGSVVGAEVLLERRDLAAVGGDESMICLGSHCLKKKKLWKRFLPKKMRRRRSGSAREEVETDSCSGSQIVSEYEQDELSIEQEEGHIDVEVLNEEACSEVSCRDRVNVVDMEGNDTGKTNVWSFRQIILIAVLLLGLLGGRAMALVVTIGCFLATRSVEVLGRKLKAYRSQRFL